jgi:hypothetical protein
MSDVQGPFGITVCGGKGETGQPGVVILLSADSMAVDANGDPCPGIHLAPSQSRRIAFLMLQIAEEMDERIRLGLTT